MFALRLTVAVGMLCLRQKERHKAMTTLILLGIVIMLGMVVMIALGQTL